MKRSFKKILEQTPIYSEKIQILQGLIYVRELTKILSEPGESEILKHLACDSHLTNHRRGIFSRRTPAFND